MYLVILTHGYSGCVLLIVGLETLFHWNEMYVMCGYRVAAPEGSVTVPARTLFRPTDAKKRILQRFAKRAA